MKLGLRTHPWTVPAGRLELEMSGLARWVTGNRVAVSSSDWQQPMCQSSKWMKSGVISTLPFSFKTEIHKIHGIDTFIRMANSWDLHGDDALTLKFASLLALKKGPCQINIPAWATLVRSASLLVAEAWIAALNGMAAFSWCARKSGGQRAQASGNKDTGLSWSVINFRLCDDWEKISYETGWSDKDKGRMWLLFIWLLCVSRKDAYIYKWNCQTRHMFEAKQRGSSHCNSHALTDWHYHIPWKYLEHFPGRYFVYWHGVILLDAWAEVVCWEQFWHKSPIVTYGNGSFAVIDMSLIFTDDELYEFNHYLGRLTTMIQLPRVPTAPRKHLAMFPNVNELHETLSLQE